MGRGVQRKAKISQDLEENVTKAHMNIRPEEFVAYVKMSTVLAAVAMALVGALLFFLLLWSFFGLMTGLILLILLIVFPPILVYAGLMASPGMARKKRERLIDARISGAMSFISAMASAEVPVDVIFKELSKEEVYGEVAEEAKWITRDTELLGVDILTSIREGAQRSPSTKFQDFLQGVVTTSQSGGQLKPFFLLKAEQFEKEDRLEMRKKMETLGMLSESFITVVVAFPLFLVVIMAIMALISKSGSEFVVQLLYVVIGLMIPMSQAGFIFVIWNMEQEA
ncbi:MAG: type II secretion system F family protein [Methanobacteriota archaeon]|nr:MAG: type II secretion system F family protein [Euryarchaeota archaeon]